MVDSVVLIDAMDPNSPMRKNRHTRKATNEPIIVANNILKKVFIYLSAFFCQLNVTQSYKIILYLHREKIHIILPFVCNCWNLYCFNNGFWCARMHQKRNKGDDGFVW